MRDLGKNSKEVLNVNPAFLFPLSERSSPHEYNVRSSSDIVSILKKPIKTDQDYLFPSWSKKHNIKSKSLNPEILDRYDEKIGR